MTYGEILTRASIWIALIGYAGGRGIMLGPMGREPWMDGARWAWTVGCLLFIVHVECAFEFYHHWSHTAAYTETASRTLQLTGLRWGGGIYLNYLFGIAWLADTAWWWIDREAFRRRSPRISATWHIFFFFMVFNGTVVFGAGAVRWLGGLICGVLTVLWCRRRMG